MPELDQKAATVFAGKVVRKDLVRKVKVGANIPVFVLEYLLGKYCATDDPAAIDAGLRVVNTTISSNFVRPDESNKVQSLVKDKGKHTLIDKVKVRYLADDDKHWAELVNFGHKYVHVPEHYLRDYWAQTVRAVGARTIVLTHWDDFFRPLDRPLRATAYVGDDLDVTVRSLDRIVETESLHFPTAWRREDPWALGDRRTLEA